VALTLQGTLRSRHLTVDLLRDSGTSIARLEGTASWTSIHIGGSSLQNEAWISIDLTR
jgi:hypothetical protein